MITFTTACVTVDSLADGRDSCFTVPSQSGNGYNAERYVRPNDAPLASLTRIQASGCLSEPMQQSDLEGRVNPVKIGGKW